MRRALLILALLLAAPMAWAGPQGEPDEELRKLMRQAMNEPDSFADRFDAELKDLLQGC